MKRVIFACPDNAGRSQMAAALFNALAHPHLASAVCAGVAPAERILPAVMIVMAEAGIDLTPEEPKLLSDTIARTADLLITVGCPDACPFVPEDRRDEWPLRDPDGQPLEVVRAIRDELRARVVRLLAANGWQSSS
ncbi:MAG: arsenate reductase ArsC [Myxococcaceae bacterium]|nr:arsenate reductase ArsC [Myxococcaceae bacterium]